MKTVLISIGLLGMTAIGVHFFIEKNANTFQEEMFFNAGCRILDKDFNLVRTLSNDWLCLPLPDGGWISSNNRSKITRFGPSGELIWLKTGYFHHQLHLYKEKFVLALELVKQKTNDQLVLYDRIVKFDLENGDLASEFQVFNYLQENKNEAQWLDRKPFLVEDPTLTEIFGTNYEKLHLNSIQSFGNKIIVNDKFATSFLLDSNLNFLSRINFPDVFHQTRNKTIHDLQMIKDTTFLVFKNFFDIKNSTRTTFKIYEFKNEKIIFEFPLKDEDFVQSDYSGGVEKIQGGYLVGFPMEETPSKKSLVGLISNDGKWVKKVIVNFRFQDIKIIRYPEYMSMNQAR